MNIEGMRHAEVVAFIKKGGDETWLLVVDPDTDEYFKRRGVIPTVSHLKGRTVLPKKAGFQDVVLSSRLWSCQARK